MQPPSSVAAIDSKALSSPPNHSEVSSIEHFRKNQHFIKWLRHLLTHNLCRKLEILSRNSHNYFQPQSAASTERHLQLENHAINVVYSKQPQQLTKRTHKIKLAKTSKYPAFFGKTILNLDLRVVPLILFTEVCNFE
jgi:hypothetical protein